jgi:hypothetical protein
MTFAAVQGSPPKASPAVSGDADRRSLMVALCEIRCALERATAGTEEEAAALVTAIGEARQRAAAFEASLPVPSRVHLLAEVFRLSAFERGMVLLGVGMELDPRFAGLCASANAAVSGTGQAGSQAWPTFGLGFALFADADWGSLSPSAPLRYWRLIEVGPGASLTSSPLRIDERVLHYLTGSDAMDERLPFLRAGLGHAPEWEFGASDLALAEQMASAWVSDACPVVQLHGRRSEQRRAIVRASSERLGIGFAIIPAASLPHDPVELKHLIRLWDREVMLRPAVLLLECGDADGATDRAAAQVAEEALGPVAVGTPTRRAVGDAALVSFEAIKPPTEAQAEAWRRRLGSRAAGMGAEIDRLVAQFDVGPAVIRATCGLLERSEEADAPPDVRGARLWEICRGQARLRLDGLAQRVVCEAGWDDLILAAPQQRMLREIELRLKHRGQVYGRWEFGRGASRGLGITALFAGASGTGKTLAAEVLANELRLDLYRIDLSAVVSKYIGETEKSLRQVFDAAEEGGVLLLFDEADALFGKRSEVKDSHDRHANIEVSYLLQRMEAYRGLAILTTNLKQALDPAFARRIQFVVDFPFPSVEERIAIWRRSFPKAAPVQEIDFTKLARLNMAGGSIRNVALAAAFFAVEDGEPIQMKHLLQAARTEGLKLERSISDAETRDWI